jgi:hypothetical protein
LFSLLRGLAGHHIFDKTDYGGDDSACYAAADRLPNHRADIDVSGRSLEDRQESCEKRSAACAAYRSGNSIAKRAEVDVLHRCACRIAADGAGYELNDEVDKRR